MCVLTPLLEDTSADWLFYGRHDWRKTYDFTSRVKEGRQDAFVYASHALCFLNLETTARSMRCSLSQDVILCLIEVQYSKAYQLQSIGIQLKSGNFIFICSNQEFLKVSVWRERLSRTTCLYYREYRLLHARGACFTDQTVILPTMIWHDESKQAHNFGLNNQRSVCPSYTWSRETGNKMTWFISLDAHTNLKI